MANTRDLKRRIKSVASSQQITNAMKMVSAAKLRKAQNLVQSVRPYAHKMEDIIEHICESGVEHHYMQARPEIRRVGYVVIGADRGLSGSYNHNFGHYLQRVLKDAPYPYGLIVIGRQMLDFCQRQDWPIDEYYTQIGDTPSFSQGRLLSEKLRSQFYEEHYDQLYVVYHEFITVLDSQPQVKRLLPLKLIESEERESQLTVSDYILEPDPETLLNSIIPQYLDVTVYSLMLEAKASEHGARMAAMSAASDNAKEMIGDLTISLNRARQAAITTEISEIVGGAAALE